MDAAQVAAFNALLGREIAAGEALVTALETERGALTGSDVEALEAATLEKERVAVDFERLDADRRRFLERLGFGPMREDMTSLIRAVEDPAYTDASRRVGPLAARWRRIVALIERCHADNQRNGMIITLQTRRVAQALNVLRTGRPDALTYGRAAPGPGLGAGGRALGRV
jgi:flagellar biosynthesis/type III secretory pathway chaperone